MTTPVGTAMAGGGVYNANSRIQATAARHGLEFLTRAAARVAPGSPLVIADYGAAEGRNSLLPVAAAITEIRKRSQSPISVVHVDRPENDFGTLFALLRSDPASYLVGQRDVYPLACGGSFYEPLLPSGSVALGWCAIAAHWLRAWPTEAPPTLVPDLAADSAKVPFAAEAKADWEAFLRSREIEMRPGASLVVVTPAAEEDGSIGRRALLYACLDEALDGLLRDGAIVDDERRRMSLPFYDRTSAEFIATFKARSTGLVLEEIVMDTADDVYWVDFQRTGDKAARARGYAGFVRAAFGPTLATALGPESPQARRSAFVEALTRRVQAAVAGTEGPLFPARYASMLITKPL
ncbi:MAG: hypothetical protein U1E45_21510 [Geminicoccaceae bacterium]